VVATREFHQRYQGSTSERLWQIVGEEPSLAKLLAQSRPVAQVGEIVGYAASVKALHGNGFALLAMRGVPGPGVLIRSDYRDAVGKPRGTRARSAVCAAKTVDWNADFDAPLKYGVETFRAFVNSWYDGTLQDVIFHTRQDEPIRRHICSVLAGLCVGHGESLHRHAGATAAGALARLCRNA